MKTRLTVVTLLALLLVACQTVSLSTSTPSPAPQAVSLTPTANPVLVAAYDPQRDSAKDVQAAVALAQSENKRILIEIGGDWCVWCHRMDAFIDGHAELPRLRNTNYLLVKVNFSPEQQNKAFFAQYPAVSAYPHIFILDSDGQLLHSQDTSELESGDSYSLEKFTAFLQKWAKP
jgi:thiol:disulfide interchange protein